MSKKKTSSVFTCYCCTHHPLFLFNFFFFNVKVDELSSVRINGCVIPRNGKSILYNTCATNKKFALSKIDLNNLRNMSYNVTSKKDNSFCLLFLRELLSFLRNVEDILDKIFILFFSKVERKINLRIDVICL